eukprot:8718624-Pyramimonas_sp.AAC.1
MRLRASRGGPSSPSWLHERPRGGRRGGWLPSSRGGLSTAPQPQELPRGGRPRDWISASPC